ADRLEPRCEHDDRCEPARRPAPHAVWCRRAGAHDRRGCRTGAADPLTSQGARAENAGRFRSTPKTTVTATTPSHAQGGTRVSRGTRGKSHARPIQANTTAATGHSTFSPRADIGCPVSMAIVARVIPQPGHHRPVAAWNGQATTRSIAVVI